MSKAIFFGYLAHGHTNPTLSLVQELAGRGEEIIYYSDEIFRTRIENAGAVFRRYKVDVMKDTTGAISTITDGVQGMLLMASGIIKSGKAIIRSMLEEIKAEKPDYIIHDSYAYWGKQIAQILNIPAVSSITTFAFGPKLVEAAPEMFMRNVLRISPDIMLKKYKTDKPAMMVETMTGYIKNMYGLKDFDILDIVVSREHLNIVYTTREFQVHEECFDDCFQFVGPSLRSPEKTTEFPFERLSGQTLIYISMGTIFNRALDFYKKCIESFKDSDVQVVMSIGDGSELKKLGDIPSNFIIMNYVPQLDILKRAAVFISHGGFNSTSEAIYYHVPLVLFPQSMDQFLVVEHVEKLGAGVYVKDSAISPEELRKIVEKVLSDDGYRQKCMAIAESFKTAGGFKKAADEILAYKERAWNLK